MNYLRRIQHLQESLKGLACDAFLVDDAINLYYLTGIQLSAGQIAVTAQNAYLLVDNRYFELCQKNSPIPVLLSDQNKAAFTSLLENQLSSVRTVGFNSDAPYKNYQNLQECLKDISAKSSRNIHLLPLDNPVKKQRAIKDADEIAILKKAGKLGAEGYDFVCSLLRPGISEIELAIELEIYWKKHGGKSLAFEPIIAFGPNSSMPHYRAGNATLKQGDCVLIDIGVNYQHYHSDMTRVIFFGEPDPQLRNIYKIVQQAQRAALELCRPGTAIGDLDQAARSVIAAQGYGPNFTHSLGHGVGLEIHEFPSIRNTAPNNTFVLQPGMVITIEPGIYVPGLGGVRLEDTVAITPHSYENLTNRPFEPFL